MNDKNQYDMPDPLDFVPGSKPAGYSQSTANPPKPTVKLFPYFLPMVINLIIFSIVQMSLSASTNALPEAQQGESGAAWMNLIILPFEFVIFIICLITIFVGLSRWSNSK